MNKDVWEEAVRENANEEVMGPCDRCEGRVCTEEGEGVPVVKRGERGGERVREGTVEEGLHLAVEITTNSASVLCRKKGWEEEDGARLLIS